MKCFRCGAELRDNLPCSCGYRPKETTCWFLSRLPDTIAFPEERPKETESPVNPPTPGIVAVIVRADGTEEVVKTSVPTADDVAVPRGKDTEDKYAGPAQPMNKTSDLEDKPDSEARKETPVKPGTGTVPDASMGKSNNKEAASDDAKAKDTPKEKAPLPSRRRFLLAFCSAAAILLAVVIGCIIFLRPAPADNLSSTVSLHYSGDLSIEPFTPVFSLDIVKSGDLNARSVTASAKAGDAYAQGILGAMYYTGTGVSVDPVKAADWFQRGAEQGDVQSQVGLGVLLYYGHGVEKSYREAASWFAAAAAQGDDFAQCALGYMYESRTGVRNQDYEAALEWYTKAAEQGNSTAQYHLGFLYAEGLGTAQDYQESAKWFEKSAVQGNPGAQNNLGFQYLNGLGVVQDYQKAADWLAKAAEQGSPDAQYNLGCMYEDGLGFAQDYQKAFTWFSRAAELGNPRAQYRLGNMYLNGKGTSQDYQKAFKCYSAAAEQGHAPSQNGLGFLYASGLGVAQDYQEAAKWFLEAANSGNSTAQSNLGYLYENGLGVEKSQEDAEKWYP